MEPNRSSYQPFLIGQGISKTGLTTYLDSWVKNEDAFDELTNAYIYRGSIYQRQGMTLYPSANGSGALVYQNNQIVSVGDGTNSYTSGVPLSVNLTDFPIFGTVTIIAKTVGGTFSSTATGIISSGAVNWSTGGASDLATAGNINFTTGAWTITTVANIAATIPITIQYNFVPTLNTTPTNNPIMGIKNHQDQTTNTTTLVVMDTRRASWYDTTTSSFVPLQSFQQNIWVGTGDATVTTTSIDLGFTNIAPYSVSVSASFGGIIQTITDIPTSSTNGNFTNAANLNSGNTSIIDYANGTVTITWTGVMDSALSPTPMVLTASLQGDYFTGDNTNFFNTTNWQTTDDQPSYLYMTNNVDRMTLFDGTYLSRPPFSNFSQDFITDSEGGFLFPIINRFKTTLDVKVYKNRLLFIRPTLTAAPIIPDGQGIAFSVVVNTANPLGNQNFIADLVNQGGSVSAPTGDWIQCAQFLRDALVVFFTQSTWLFRFTGNTQDVLRFDKINGSRSTNAPYGSVEYDAMCTSMGAKGLISCNGVAVDRYDTSIIDAIEAINQNSFAQCYGQKYDTLNQTWMLYPSQSGSFSTSDSILVFNYLENTWSVFRHNLGSLIQDETVANTLSCLGLAAGTRDLQWQDFAVGTAYFNGLGQTWSQATYSWNSFEEQDLAPALIGGDQNGFVYIMQNGPADIPGPAGTEARGIPTTIKTKLLNPYISQGVKAKYGYLDIYYEVNAEIDLTFKFYLNNSTAASITRDVTLNGSANNTWAWKRIFISAVAEFIQIEISSIIGTNDDGSYIYETGGAFKILGMILYAGPAGRLTPGTFL